MAVLSQKKMKKVYFREPVGVQEVICRTDYPEKQVMQSPQRAVRRFSGGAA